MKKKLAAVLLATAVTAAMLAGCGGSAQSSSTAEEKTEEAQEAPGAEAEAPGLQPRWLEPLCADRRASLTSLTWRSPLGSTAQGTSLPAKQSQHLGPMGCPAPGSSCRSTLPHLLHSHPPRGHLGHSGRVCLWPK